MRVAGYARVSSVDQVSGYSLEVQERAIRAHCAARSWPAPVLYVEPGVSAFTDRLDRRPQFAALMEAIGRREYDALVVAKLDRFARSIVVATQQLRHCLAHGCALVSLAEQWDFGTASGQLQYQIMSALAEYQSRNAGELVRRSLLAKRDKGLHIGRPPWGSVRREGVLSVDPARADQLRYFLEQLAETNDYEVARRMNRAEIPAPLGRWWTVSGVRAYRRQHGSWLRDQGQPWASLYEAALAGARAVSPRLRSDDRARMLTGLMRCGVCGGAIVVGGAYRYRDGRVRYTLRCRHQERVGLGACPGPRRTYLDVYEGQVTRWLLSLPDPSWEKVEAVDTSGQQAALDARRRRLSRQHLDGIVSDTEYEQERAALADAYGRLPSSSVRRRALARGLRLAQETWGNWGPEAKNLYLRGILVRVEIVGHVATPVLRPEFAGLWPGDSNAAVGDER